MKLFYLKNCPYCRQALTWIQELYQEDEKYQQVPLEMIEESEQSELADRYDYYYVPCFLKIRKNFMKEQLLKTLFKRYLRTI
ncbi:glutaredoxin [Allocoprobacillus halotolerans]|uniref:Glutaredoxin n=1 Tax=Allocoprobacillus halotolerans TaxID=2944914 RepID=A0ABY5I1N4_9FIRM|nr:glutaredoxin [Allocoprobacillus halotolerans]UTY38011.1 glutaredoxin [Allocoprobacillus halotolerans]